MTILCIGKRLGGGERNFILAVTDIDRSRTRGRSEVDAADRDGAIKLSKLTASDNFLNAVCFRSHAYGLITRRSYLGVRQNQRIGEARSASRRKQKYGSQYNKVPLPHFPTSMSRGARGARRVPIS